MVKPLVRFVLKRNFRPVYKVVKRSEITLSNLAISRGTTWSVLSKIYSNRSTTWNISSVVTADRITSWSVGGYINKNISTTWNINSEDVNYSFIIDENGLTYLDEFNNSFTDGTAI